jgi:transposase
MLKMVQQEYIRYLHFQEGVSIREISRRTGHHRATIRRYLEAPRPKYERQAKPHYPVLGPYLHLIDAWLIGDQKVKKKQRHTARRIYQRLRDEHGFRGGESTVRDYVRRRRRELGLQEVYLPLHFRPGESMQVDWGEANVFDNSRHCEAKVYMFCARLAYSTDIFVRLYPHNRMEAFLDGLRRSFEHFGGVPAEVVLDNMRTAVKRFIGWQGREETDAFLSFRTHYVVRSRFCNPRSGHEKGLVENLVGYGRRNFLVPMPCVPSVNAQGLEALNEQLLQACIAKRSMQRANSTETVAELYEKERALFHRLPEYPYDCATRVIAHVDNCARVRFDTNLYSVPYLYAGRRVELKVYVDRIEAMADGRVIATHPRSYGRHGQFTELDHYLEVLFRKPGGLTHFRGWQNHRLPSCYEDLLQAMLEAGRSVKEFVEVLLLRRDHADPETVDSAVATSLNRRCPHLEAIRQLADRESETDIDPASAEVPEALRTHRVAPPDVSCYQQLAMTGVAS